MSEAGRLLHAGTNEERALLRAGADEGPSEESVLAAARALGLAPRALLFASLAALLSKVLKGSSITVAAFVVAPVFVAGGVTVAVLAGRADTRPKVVVAPVSATEGPSAPLTAEPVETPPATSASAPAAVAPVDGVHGAAPSKKGTAAAPRASQDADLAEQVRLVDRARGLVAAGDASGALAAVDAYERRFVRGILAEEAALVRVEATQARGDHAEAASLARRFLAAYPASVHRSKVQWLLGDGTK